MKEYLPLLFAIIAGVFLVFIALRNKIPLWGGLLSSNMKIQLSRTDKILALIALVFFILSMFSLAYTV